jgi:uncharacterized protein (DUF58 family)
LETKDLFRKIQRLEIKAKGLTNHIFSGEYHSAFKGRGMTFSEVREYEFGDEIRTIDWNVTARYNDPYVKVFEEERELSILLIVDVSGSSEFGSKLKSKKELALEIAAVLAFSAIANNDKIGAVFLTDHVEKYIPPAKGRKHVLFLLHELIKFQPVNSTTNLKEGLEFIRKTQKKRSVVFLISDFISQMEFMKDIQLTKKRHDTIAIKINDVAESNIPNLGLIQLFNAETGSKTWVDTSSKEVREYLVNSSKKEEEQLIKKLKKIGVDSIICQTHEDFVKPLIQLFHQRK